MPMATAVDVLLAHQNSGRRGSVATGSGGSEAFAIACRMSTESTATPSGRGDLLEAGWAVHICQHLTKFSGSAETVVLACRAIAALGGEGIGVASRGRAALIEAGALQAVLCSMRN